MANEARGEIDVKGRDGQSYVFRLSANAICALEDAVGKSALELCEELRVGKVPVKSLRAFVKVASAGEPNLSNEAAGDIVQQIGAIPLIAAMTEGLLGLFDVAPGKKKNPRKPTSDAPTGSGDSKMAPKLA